MSAEKTNIETQAKRHSPALLGIAAVLAFVGVIFVGFLYATTTTDVDEVDAWVTLPNEESS